jgi:integrase
MWVFSKHAVLNADQVKRVPPRQYELAAASPYAMRRDAPAGANGRRLRGLIVILWRPGLRSQEALALTEGDLDPRRGSLLVGRGKGGRRREVGMADWGWQESDRALPECLCGVRRDT